MIKKSVSLLIVLTMLFVSICSVSAREAPERSITKLSSNIAIDYSKDYGPIMPGNSITIKLNISHWIEKEGLFSNFYYNLLKNRGGTIKLEVTGLPEWVDCSFPKESIGINLSDKKSYTSTYLTVKANKDAPAGIKEDIVINATFEPIVGKLGFFTLIKGSNDTVTIPISAKYIPLIDVNISKPNVKVTPFNVTNITISVKNNGNAESIISFELVNFNKTWGQSIIPKQLTVGVGKTGKAVLSFKADNNFDTETMQLKITTSPTPSVTGNSTYETYNIGIQNDGSYVEPKKSLIDTTILIIVLVVILAAIIVIGLILKRRKSQ